LFIAEYIYGNFTSRLLIDYQFRINQRVLLKYLVLFVVPLPSDPLGALDKNISNKKDKFNL